MVANPYTLLARGNTSDVYRWGRNAVAKVLRPGIPRGWADEEARLTQLVGEAGLPAPEVLDLTMIGERPAIVFELVEGALMWAEMLRRPESIPRLSRMLAELQAEVNATPAPSGMPRLHEKLRANVESAPALSPSERSAVCAQLDRLCDHRALCHFDVHPNNVLLARHGPVLIDWFDAAAGCPAADIARSSILMRPIAADDHLQCADPSVVSAVHDAYVVSVLETHPWVDSQLLGWERAVLAGRLAEPLGEGSREYAIKALRALQASEPSPLAVSLRFARSNLTLSGSGSHHAR